MSEYLEEKVLLIPGIRAFTAKLRSAYPVAIGKVGMGAALLQISSAVAIEGIRAAIDYGRAIGIEGRRTPSSGTETMILLNCLANRSALLDSIMIPEPIDSDACFFFDLLIKRRQKENTQDEVPEVIFRKYPWKERSLFERFLPEDDYST
jgi:hypothetical protein